MQCLQQQLGFLVALAGLRSCGFGFPVHYQKLDEHGESFDDLDAPDAPGNGELSVQVFAGFCFETQEDY